MSHPSQSASSQPGSVFTIEVNPRIPARLERLHDLAFNLWYSWDRPTRRLFARLHPALWEAVNRSPKAMLKRIDEDRLVAAAADQAFLASFDAILAAFDAYMADSPEDARAVLTEPGELVAYFCAEFAFHESLPIYSGGLGILAGDHCKAASDARLPFVAVGLLYRQGYFVQSIDAEGNQLPEYFDSSFADLPIVPATTADGVDLRFDLQLGERSVAIEVWRARIGHVDLYLLDTDVAPNSEHDRDIAHRLYGGDLTTRLEQELILGIGGVRALAALDIRPTVWHVNEGHPAFLILERLRVATSAGTDVDAALEAVAANTVFTTHTPVPAGHDHFPEDMIATYLRPLCDDRTLHLDRVLALGRPPGGGDFNMTTLALRGSRHHNGVSQIHGRVSARMLQDMWPQITPDENPIDSITNGVHIPTFLAPEWSEVFDRFVGNGWINRLDDPKTREQIHAIPDQVFWAVRQNLKTQLLHMVRQRIRHQHLRNQGSESHLDRMLRCVDPQDPGILTFGFGRRFATYKRATLLFEDLEVMRRIVGSTDRSVVFIFSGKAHPADAPGQDLIRAITRIARLPEFEARILLVEGYDIRFARRLVSGVDVWLNNPVYPLEASGTSGMKAGMNGVINLSVLDGWWGEGFDGDNGWAIKPAAASLDAQRRDREEAQTLYEIIQERVVPLYYARDAGGYSPDWIKMAKRSMASLLPRYNAARMVNEYVQKFYVPGSQQGHLYRADDGHVARAIAEWKARISGAWDGVAIRRLDDPPKHMQFGDRLTVAAAVRLNGLTPDDVTVELLQSRGVRELGDPRQRHALIAEGGCNEDGEQRFSLDLKPELCGRLDQRIRVYPSHSHLTHPFETGRMLWA